MKVLITLGVVVVVVYAVGTLLSSPIINAKKYRNLLKVEEENLRKTLKNYRLTKFRYWTKNRLPFLEIVKWEVW